MMTSRLAAAMATPSVRENGQTPITASSGAKIGPLAKVVHALITMTKWRLPVCCHSRYDSENVQDGSNGNGRR